MKQTLSPSCDVSRETSQRLTVFADLLRTWSRRINLISPRDLDAIWLRHIEDSLQLLPSLAEAVPPWIDLGSGAGFPGLVVAMASGAHVHLIEADQRKAAFLREAARVTETNVTVHASRIEATSIPPVSVVMARALAPLPALLTLAAPFLSPNGVCLFLKGRSHPSELTTAAAQWHMRVERTPSVTDPAAAILKLSELRFVGTGGRDHPSDPLCRT